MQTRSRSDRIPINRLETRVWQALCFVIVRGTQIMRASRAKEGQGLSVSAHRKQSMRLPSHLHTKAAPDEEYAADMPLESCLPVAADIW